MKIGCPKEIKVHEYRVGLVPAGVRELVAAGHEVMVETNAGAGIGIGDDAYRAAGARVLPDAKSVFATGRDGRQGQGAAAARMRAAQPRPGPVHLPAPRRGRGAGEGAREVRRDGDRLRDRDCAGPLAAAPDADERSRRPHVHPGRRDCAAEGQRRVRRAARRRARRCAGAGRDPGRRRRRHERDPDGGRPRGPGDGRRSLAEAAARTRRAVRQPDRDRLFDDRGRRAAGHPGGTRHRRGAGDRAPRRPSS